MTTLIKKLFAKINFFYYSLFIFLLTIPCLSFAATTPQADISESFRLNLLSSLGGALADGSINASIQPLIHGLTAICFIVAIFQTIYNSGNFSPGFLVEWVKIPIYAFMAMSITGQSRAYQNFFPAPTNIPAYATGPRTLDTDIYFTLTGIFGEVADNIKGSFGPATYQVELKSLMTTMRGFSSAISNCKNPGSRFYRHYYCS